MAEKTTVTQEDRERAERWLKVWLSGFFHPPATVESLAQAFADRVAEARLQWRSRMGLTPSTDAAISEARAARDVEIVEAIRKRAAAARKDANATAAACEGEDSGIRAAEDLDCEAVTLNRLADRIEASKGGLL